MQKLFNPEVYMGMLQYTSTYYQQSSYASITTWGIDKVVELLKNRPEKEDWKFMCSQSDWLDYEKWKPESLKITNPDNWTYSHIEFNTWRGANKELFQMMEKKMYHMGFTKEDAELFRKLDDSLYEKNEDGSRKVYNMISHF